jgi:hypothetical protein
LLSFAGRLAEKAELRADRYRDAASSFVVGFPAGAVIALMDAQYTARNAIVAGRQNLS